MPLTPPRDRKRNDPPLNPQIVLLPNSVCVFYFAAASRNIGTFL